MAKDFLRLSVAQNKKVLMERKDLHWDKTLYRATKLMRDNY